MYRTSGISGPRRWPRSPVFYKDVDTPHRLHDATGDHRRRPLSQVTGPFNGDGGGIAGVELTFQTPFASKVSLRNFGVYMNYAYVDTDVKEFYPSTDPLPIEGYAEEHGE